jgi:hypothetical protein
MRQHSRILALTLALVPALLLGAPSPTAAQPLRRGPMIAATVSGISLGGLIVLDIATSPRAVRQFHELYPDEPPRSPRKGRHHVCGGYCSSHGAWSCAVFREPGRDTCRR